MLKGLFTTIFCLFFCLGDLMGKENMLIFMTPIAEGKTATLKKNISLDDDESLFADLSISKYSRWIQTINENDYLIHQLKGHNIEKSLEDLKTQIAQKNPSALALQALYKDTLGLDIKDNHWIPQRSEVTELMDMHMERSSEDSSKEYCFVYPVLPSKKKTLLGLYADKAVYNSTQIQNIYKFRGIDKIQQWLQESNGDLFLVVYQDIIGPVGDARNKYLDTKEESLSRYLADIYSEVTGLSYEKLLPTMESLDDAEVLK